MSELTLLTGLLFLAGSLGCKGTGQAAPLDNTVLNAGLDPQNRQVRALVAHFDAHGVKLSHERDSWWRVTHPAVPGFDVIVSLRSFPENASASQLQESLERINLAYVLNAGAHVAMSYPSLRGARPADIADPRFVELKAKLERLFHEYRTEPGKS
jgi:hypothetical protein